MITETSKMHALLVIGAKKNKKKACKRASSVGGEGLEILVRAV